MAMPPNEAVEKPKKIFLQVSLNPSQHDDPRLQSDIRDQVLQI
jgi:hypothetical protein